MSEDIKIRITADASGVTTATTKTKEELRGLEATGSTMATGLKAGLVGVTLAMAPLIAAMTVIRGIGAFIKIADEAVQADAKISRLAKATKDSQVGISGGFTEIRNAVMKFALAVNDGTGAIGAIGKVMSEVAQVIAIFAKQLSASASESDKIGTNQGAISFAQGVGKAFAYMGDLVGAVAKTVFDSAKLIWDILATITRALGGVGEALAAMASGDFSMAGETIKQTTLGVGRAIADMARTGYEDIGRLTASILGNGAALTAYRDQLAAGTKIDLSSPDKEKKGKDDGNRSVIRELQAYSDELDKQIAKLREKGEVNARLIQVEIDGVKSAALARIDSEEQAAKFALQNKEITNAQLLAMEQQFEDRRYAIKQQALANELALKQASGDDPVAVAQLNEQLLELERQFQMKKAEIAQQVAQEAQGGGKGGKAVKNVFEDLQQSMTQALDAMLARTATFGQAMRNVWASLRQSVIGEVSKMLMAKVSAFAKEKLLALAHISAEGAKAGAGAASSQASIPIVGPAMALAAMASVLASVLGLGSGIKSAAGGFDIPAGLNPVTQLHGSEMVLPADIANPLRDSLSGGSGREVNINLQGVSAGEFFIAVRKDLVAALKNAHREFAF